MVLNSGIRDLAAGLKKTANRVLNEAIAAKLHMCLNSGTMPQIAIAGYSGRFKTLMNFTSYDVNNLYIGLP